MQKVISLRNTILLSLIILLFSACSARKARNEKTLFNAPTDYVTDTIKQVYVVNDQGYGDIYYKIKVNDVIAIRNLQNQEFGVAGTTLNLNEASSAITYTVDPEGSVNLPAIGKINIVGLTRREVADKLQKIYETSLKKPIIDVTIVNVKVTLLGEFGTQGNFLLERDNTTLIDIIGKAGGINTKTADPKTLKIIRGDRSHPEIIYVNLNDINSLASRKLILQNNDLIIIQPTKNIALTEKLTGFNNLLQPLLVIINLGLLIFTFTK